MSKKKMAWLTALLLLLLAGGYVYRLWSQRELKMICLSNLRAIGLALHNYEAVHGTLPPRVTRDENGKVLHSWRTMLLPFLEEGELYAKIDLSKPWNDPVNASVLAKPVWAYRCPTANASELECPYVAIAGPDSVFGEADGVSFEEILDRYNTLAVVETGQPISHWAEPIDLDASDIVIDVNKPGSQIASRHAEGVCCLTSSGATIVLPTGHKASDICRNAKKSSGESLAKLGDAPSDLLLQKFIKEGGPSRQLEIAKPAEPELSPEALELKVGIEELDWLGLYERLQSPFPKDQRPLAERLLETTGNGRFILALTHYEIDNLEGTKYWLQEAAIEEGFTSFEAQQVSSLVRADEQAQEVMANMANAVSRYWRQAERPKPRLHLPSKRESSGPLRLVVLLHPDRSSPNFWDANFCDRLAQQYQVAVLIPTATVHYGPERYHWTEDYAQHYRRDHEQIEKSLAEVSSQFEEHAGQRVLVGLNQSAYLVMNITNKHTDKYASAVIIHPGMIDAVAQRAQALVDDAKKQADIKQRYYILYEPDEYREKFASFISKTLTPTGREVELKLDEEASFIYPKLLTTDPDLAPKIDASIDAVLNN